MSVFTDSVFIIYCTQNHLVVTVNIQTYLQLVNNILSTHSARTTHQQCYQNMKIGIACINFGHLIQIKAQLIKTMFHLWWLPFLHTCKVPIACIDNICKYNHLSEDTTAWMDQLTAANFKYSCGYAGICINHLVSSTMLQQYADYRLVVLVRCCSFCAGFFSNILIVGVN